VYLWAFSIRLVRPITSLYCFKLSEISVDLFDWLSPALLSLISIEQHSNHLPTTLLHVIQWPTRCTSAANSTSFGNQYIGMLISRFATAHCVLVIFRDLLLPSLLLLLLVCAAAAQSFAVLCAAV
jgi:hypothetical protein